MNSLDDIEQFAKEVKFLYIQSDEKLRASAFTILKDLFQEISSNVQDEFEVSEKSTLLISIENQKLLLKQKKEIIDEYVLMTISDLSGKILDISQAYLDFTGYTKEEVIGKNHKIFKNQDIDKSVIKNLWDTILQDKIWKGELKNHKSTGEEYWINTVIKPLYDKNNIKIGYISIKEDITTKKRLEELSIKDPLTQLYNRRQFEHSIKRDFNRSNSQHQSIALIILEIDYYQEYKHKYGDSEAYKLVLDISKMLSIELQTGVGEIFKISDSEFAIIILNKSKTYIENFANKLLESIQELKIENSQSKVSKYLTVSMGLVNLDTNAYNINCNDLYNIVDSNLSKAKKRGGDKIVYEMDEEYIHNLKDIDNITKLPNRISLINDLAGLQQEAMLIILHINQLNSLKELYGFKFASDLIFKKAQELKRVFNSQETTLYNLNLQEFAILITDKNLFEKYFLILKHSILMSDISDEHSSSNYVNADFTAGISYGVQKIFNHADLVLQEALISKVSCMTYKNNQSAKQLQVDNFQRLKIYKNALHTGKIIPYFQPIIDANDSSIIKYEALARIQTDNGEIISPYHFLDSAHEDKTFEYFTRQMMQKVFNIFSKSDAHISININYQNISSETMVEYIENRLEKYGGNGITFEILETEDIINYDIVGTFIQMVKTYGCKVSIDDFGAGYSNFTNIIKLDIDYIKLDGSLIEKLNTDENVKHMVKGLVLYAKNTNIKIIAEFVSSQELADTVRELGIDYFQGYYYGEPQPPEFYGLI